METRPNAEGQEPILRRFTLLSAIVAGLFATATLVGWGAGWLLLCQILPGSPAMNPLTAVSLILCAVSVGWLCEGSEQADRLARGSAVIAWLIGTARLVSFAFPWSTPPDQWLFHAQLAAALAPSQMGIHTSLAVTFLASGLGLLTLRRASSLVTGWAGGLLLVAAAVPLVGLVGYLYGAETLHGAMAINTAIGSLGMAVGALVARRDRGLSPLLLSRGPGGVSTRTLLPAAIVIPLVLGWLRLEAQHRGWVGLEMGTAAFASAIVLVLVAVILLTGGRLDEMGARQVEAERAALVLRERERRLFDIGLIGVLIAENDQVVDANDAFLRMLDYSREDLPLASATITPPDWRQPTERARRELADRALVTPFEKEYLRRDGGRVPVLVGGSALPDEPGRAIVYVVDLRGSKKAEQDAHRARMFLDSVIENLPSMVFVKDAGDLRFVRLNHAGEVLLGHSAESLIGRNDYDFFPREQADSFTAKDRAVLEGGRLVDIPEEEIQTASGETRVLHTKKVPIVDHDGTPLYLLGISEDVTERKRSEEKLAELNRGLRQRTAELESVNHELESFSYSVSHDLRAPLRHIDGFADLLLRHAGPSLDDKARRHLDVISEAAKSMGQLIDDLLDFSRVGRTELRHAPVDLGLLVEDVRRGLETEGGPRDVEWRIGPLPTVHGDRAMLRLVFVNLLSNALKYTRPRENTVVQVGARHEGDEVVVFVRDNGVGFDMKYAHKLFGVFQRLHGDADFEGTGIGLANVRRVIQRHGGRTWAESRVDEGATFYLGLPRILLAEERKAA
jgi:PAS domain S-box-containing protein